MLYVENKDSLYDIIMQAHIYASTKSNLHAKPILRKTLSVL